MPNCRITFPTHNNYQRKPDSSTGICMGASAYWCREAKFGRFISNPHKAGKSLQKSKDLTCGFCDDQTGTIVLRLKKLLYDAGIDSVSTVAQTSAGAVVGHIRDHPGIYLFIAGTHVMGASSLPHRLYFFDNENGLYSCGDPTALYAQIKKLRRDEWGLVGQYGWYAVKCV